MSADRRALRRQFERVGRWHGVPQDRPYDPAQGDFVPTAGDIVFFGTDGRENHVPFALRVRRAGAWVIIETLEGNTWSGAARESDPGAVAGANAGTATSETWATLAPPCVRDSVRVPAPGFANRPRTTAVYPRRGRRAPPDRGAPARSRARSAPRP